MKITVGNKELIERAKLLVPEDETAWISFDYEGWNIKINLVFVVDPLDKRSRFDFKGIKDYAELKLYNWGGHSPFTFDDYQKIGVATNGKSIYLMVYGDKCGRIHNIDLSFMVEV